MGFYIGIRSWLLLKFLCVNPCPFGLPEILSVAHLQAFDVSLFKTMPPQVLQPRGQGSLCGRGSSIPVKDICYRAAPPSTLLFLAPEHYSESPIWHS